MSTSRPSPAHCPRRTRSPGRADSSATLASRRPRCTEVLPPGGHHRQSPGPLPLPGRTGGDTQISQPDQSGGDPRRRHGRSRRTSASAAASHPCGSTSVAAITDMITEHVPPRRSLAAAPPELSPSKPDLSRAAARMAIQRVVRGSRGMMGPSDSWVTNRGDDRLSRPTAQLWPGNPPSSCECSTSSSSARARAAPPSGPTATPLRSQCKPCQRSRRRAAAAPTAQSFGSRPPPFDKKDHPILQGDVQDPWRRLQADKLKSRSPGLLGQENRRLGHPAPWSELDQCRLHRVDAGNAAPASTDPASRRADGARRRRPSSLPGINVEVQPLPKSPGELEALWPMFVQCIEPDSLASSQVSLELSDEEMFADLPAQRMPQHLRAGCAAPSS